MEPPCRTAHERCSNRPAGRPLSAVHINFNRQLSVEGSPDICDGQECAEDSPQIRPESVFIRNSDMFQKETAYARPREIHDFDRGALFSRVATENPFQREDDEVERL